MTRRKIAKLNLGFNIGDIVNIDPEHLYVAYTQFANRHPKYAVRYQYKVHQPKNTECKALGVYRHVCKDRLDRNKYCVVVADMFNRVYFVGELGCIPSRR